jgi:hypothetical protein
VGRGAAEKPPDPDDPWDAIIRAQRFDVNDDAGARIPLEVAMLHVEHRFPHAFYAPGRWDTADGYIPFRLCWIYFDFLRATLALDALQTARGIGIAFADPDAPRSAGEDAIRDAFPRAR